MSPDIYAFLPRTQIEAIKFSHGSYQQCEDKTYLTDKWMELVCLITVIKSFLDHALTSLLW